MALSYTANIYLHPTLQNLTMNCYPKCHDLETQAMTLALNVMHCRLEIRDTRDQYQ